MVWLTVFLNDLCMQVDGKFATGCNEEPEITTKVILLLHYVTYRCSTENTQI